MGNDMKITSILVVDDGRIVERGTHDELIALDGRYAALVASARF